MVGAAGEIQQGVDVGRRRDRHLLAVAGTVSDGAGGKAGIGQRRNRFHRAEQLHQIGDVVGAKVQHRAAAGLEEEIGVGVPGFHPPAHHMRAARHDPADGPGINGRPRQLMRAAKEGVRRRAQAQALLGRQVLQVAAPRPVSGPAAFPNRRACRPVGSPWTPHNARREPSGSPPRPTSAAFSRSSTVSARTPNSAARARAASMLMSATATSRSDLNSGASRR